MKIDTIYNIKIHKNMLCQAGEAVFKMTDALSKDEELKVKLVIGKDKKSGTWPVYLEKETSDNSALVGTLDLFTGPDGPVDDTDTKIIAGLNYRFVITGPQTRPDLVGTLQTLKEDGAKKATSSESNTLKDLIREKIEAGIVTQEDMDARMAVFKANDVDEPLMRRIIRRYRKYNKPTHRPSTIYVDPYIEHYRKIGEPGLITEGLRSAASRFALICEGEKSVGKNVYLETIAWLMNMPMYLITFTRQMSPASIYGEKTTDNSAAAELAAFDPEILNKADLVRDKLKFAMNLLFKQGKGANEASDAAMAALPEADRETLKQAAEFQKLQAQSASVNIVIDASELYDWLIDGGLMCFNEQNMAEANFFASFANQLLDGTGFLFIPGRGAVKIHKDCVLFGTQNADYQGVEQQNEATMSRYGCLYFEQPESIKPQLVAAVAAALARDGYKGVTLDKKYYTQAENFYKQCRAAVQKADVTNACLNIRGFVRALVEVAESEGYAKLLRGVVKHVIETCPYDERSNLKSIASSCISL